MLLPRIFDLDSWIAMGEVAHSFGTLATVSGERWVKANPPYLFDIICNIKAIDERRQDGTA